MSLSERIKNDSLPDLTPEEIAKALKRPDSFAYFGNNKEMFKTWALGPVIEHRDSGLLDQSNAAMLRKALKDRGFTKRDYYISESSHWAVGYVTHLTYRVVNKNGKASKIARFLKAWWKGLDNYPVADEFDYSERESEATYDNLKLAAEHLLKDNPPKDWHDQLWQWYNENDEIALENVDDQGGWPSDESLKEALGALNLLKSEDD